MSKSFYDINNMRYFYPGQKDNKRIVKKKLKRLKEMESFWKNMK